MFIIHQINSLCYYFPNIFTGGCIVKYTIGRSKDIILISVFDKRKALIPIQTSIKAISSPSLFFFYYDFNIFRKIIQFIQLTCNSFSRTFGYRKHKRYDNT